jgi:2,4-dienoyl-CoA reductase-like NADH-dependent reductase (Old Yellow Enzyme family)
MPNRLALAPLTNTQSLSDGRLGDDELRWLALRAAGAGL